MIESFRGDWSLAYFRSSQLDSAEGIAAAPLLLALACLVAWNSGLTISGLLLLHLCLLQLFLVRILRILFFATSFRW